MNKDAWLDASNPDLQDIRDALQSGGFGAGWRPQVPELAQPKTLTDDLLVQLFYAAQGDITQFRIKARALLEAK